MSNVKKLLALLFFPVLLFSPAPAESSDPSLNDEVLGLIVFKSDLHDPDQKLASWNEDDATPCGWAGVRCNPRTSQVTELVLDGYSLSGRVGRGVLQLQFLRRLSLSDNNLNGPLNSDLLKLQNLKVLDLSNNGLSGSIPEEFFGQCGSLRALSLAKNGFSGKIPDSISSCSSLVDLNLSLNRFSGSLPSGIWLLNALRSLDLSGNSLEGEIPNGIGGLRDLHILNLSKNLFTGSLPAEIGTCSLLKSIDVSDNSLSGNVPESMQKLRLCMHLNLRKNALEGEIPSWIGEMDSLETLDLSMNKFTGAVPESIGKLLLLKKLILSGNGLTGSLPESMANCASLLDLDFSRNSITGDLPGWIFRLGSDQVSVSKSNKPNGRNNYVQKLQVLDLSWNSFSGEIGPGIGGFMDLQVLNLSMNSLVGPIPAAIGELRSLDVIDLSGNELNGSIPQEICGAVSLKELRLENNLLNGKIPSIIGNCSSLQSLIVSQNKLGGFVPEEIAKLSNLRNVDLSFNDFSGTLPKQLASLSNLYNFNISHNHFEGELPTGGFFNTISPSSVFGNPSLCGSVVNNSCPTVLPKPIVLNPNSSSDPTHGVNPHDLNHRRIVLSISSLVAISAAAVIFVGVIAITVINLRVRKTIASKSADPFVLSNGHDSSRSPTTDSNSGKLVVFPGEPDNFSTGTHALLHKDCELGRGGFGAVYAAALRDGRQVAIKKLTVSSLVKSQEEFEREVKKLGKLRHANLVSLKGYYWTPSLQLLIYEFIPNGNLYNHLHEESRSFLSWNQRFNIILGTAKGLAYLHQSNIVHYNIKSSNVLIDDDHPGKAKVGDYGLANLLPMLDRYALSTKIQSALGYMAPELACRTIKITEKCDVYGFGVLVLEVVTGKKPVEYMEDDVVVLCDAVRIAVEEGRVEECIDGKLLGKFPAEEAVSVMKLGLICTSQVPSNRPDMAEVVNILEMIRYRSSDSPS